MAELCRSEEPHQRSLGVRMFQGVLGRRDAVVALEAYGRADARADFHLGQDKDHAKSKNKEREKEKEKDSECVVSSYRQLNEHVIQRTLQLLSEEGYRVEREDWGDDMPDIRRVVTYVLLLCCCSDLPVMLPPLLLWSLHSTQGGRGRSWGARLGVLSCLRQYLCCPVEEQAAADAWAGLLGVYGTPRLPLPHVRREQEKTYEQLSLDCWLQQQDETAGQGGQIQQGGQQGGQQEASYVRQLAWACRWGALSAMMAQQGVVKAITGNLVPALDALLQHARRAVGGDGGSIDAAERGMYDTLAKVAAESVEVLSVVLRGGDLLVSFSFRGVIEGAITLYW